MARQRDLLAVHADFRQNRHVISIAMINMDEYRRG